MDKPRATSVMDFVRSMLVKYQGTVQVCVVLNGIRDRLTKDQEQAGELAGCPIHSHVGEYCTKLIGTAIDMLVQMPDLQSFREHLPHIAEAVYDQMRVWMYG